MKDNPQVLVIIVTYNAMQWAEKCLSSLKHSSRKADVIIIDNGSKDSTAYFVKGHYPEYTLIEPGKNLGFGAANNIGLKYAIEHDYDYVYLLNQDAWIFHDTIQKLIDISQSYPDYGIISPMQYSGDEITLDAGFQRIFDSTNKTTDEIVEVPFIMAAHWFIPCRFIKKIGGFSPTFFHYGEDNNIIDRIHFHGLKVGVHKSSKGVHDRYNRPISKDKKIYLKKTSNLIRMSSPLKPLWKSTLLSLFLSIIFSLKTFCFTPLLDYIAILKNLPEIRQNRKISRKIGPSFL